MSSDDTSRQEPPRPAPFVRGDQDETRSEMLSMSAVFELMAERRRRYALYHLVDADSPVDFDDLVDAVVDWETGDLDPPRGHESRVLSSLHHSHLQRLETEGVVAYDADTGLVWYLGSEKLEAQLSESRDAELP
ncbi:DUF7344 domain-containing protein [Halostella pelagica]|uniref:DUF7344 domain-containing protein n=1 Tax=Halostella pelagica TaxID=2583824 RepID=UPI0010805D07|nr:hypothetical protein [Halostella pelagica]